MNNLETINNVLVKLISDDPQKNENRLIDERVYEHNYFNCHFMCVYDRSMKRNISTNKTKLKWNIQMDRNIELLELTVGLPPRATDPPRPFARNLLMACSAKSARSSDSSNSC